MSKFYTVLLGCLLLAPAAHAAALSADAITKGIEAAGGDPAKVKAYCAMTKKMDEVGDDQKKAEAAGDEIDGYFKTLGDDFQAAFDAGQDAADNSAEAKAFDAATTKLDGQCK
jgi:hypothetical protein